MVNPASASLHLAKPENQRQRQQGQSNDWQRENSDK
jgi:hypothetical protein